MSCKSFNIRVVLDILNVTCPGVWICPKGMVYLDIWLFGHNSSTSYTEPKFPLIFNETFTFHKNLTDLTNLSDVQKCLKEKYMRIALVQVYKKKQVILAKYNSNVDEVLYSERSRLSRSGEMQVLMKNEPLFPGTISPKIALTTKTSVTDQIHVISSDDNCSSQNSSEKLNQPLRMRKVHHTKGINSDCFHKKGYRKSSNENKSSSTDSDTDSQMYCQRSIKGSEEGDEMNYECHFKKTCKYCEDINKLGTMRTRKENDERKNIKTSLETKNKCLDNNEHKCFETVRKKFGKNIIATFQVGVHHNKCCKLINSCGTNESIKTSDEECEGKIVRKWSDHEKREPSGEKPRKMSPKIKAQLHLDVYHCKCGMPGCKSSPSWSNICNEVNRKDIVADELKYYISLRNYYRRLYDGVTYQLGRNAKLL